MRAGRAGHRREGRPAGAREGQGPWALALSCSIHAAVLGALAALAAAERPPVPSPPVFSVDLVVGSGETGGETGGAMDGEPGPPSASASDPPSPQAPSETTAEPVVEPAQLESALPDPEPPVPVSPPSTPVPGRKPLPKRAPPADATSQHVQHAPTRAITGGKDAEAAPATAGPAGRDDRGSGAGAAVAGGVADAMPAYLEEVRRRLQAKLAMPEEARRLRLGGTVLVRFLIGADGAVDTASVAVVSGGGVAALAHAAVAAVIRAAPFPPPPKPALVEVPAAFSIR